MPRRWGEGGSWGATRGENESASGWTYGAVVYSKSIKGGNKHHSVLFPSTAIQGVVDMAYIHIHTPRAKIPAERLSVYFTYM